MIGIALSERPQGVDGVDQPALDLDPRRREAQIVLDGEGRHLKPHVCGRAVAPVLVWRRGRRDEHHAGEAEGVTGLGGDREMSRVRRVEAPAEDTQTRLGGDHEATPSPARRPTART